MGMVRTLVVLALCGCHSLAPTALTSAPERVVSGSVREVNGRVAKAYREAGVSGGACAAWMDEQGEGMSVLGKTSDGRTFRLMLRQSGRKSTRAEVKWDGEPDDALGRKILSGLGAE